ncbi:hypothetical protein TWF106_008675 [Orbilia oligospora]|uniref:Peptidase S8/S53 domain-containing protein n=1 Tax=Orbilia oligospora TaxID=2813651 RepID=A0A6G1M6Z5_ORBOL|nr:hypothetical protein TWF788_006782 [Orbilia oligospora]KAF3203056.1 hypothetical protein TWF679_010522 [Orbilia oligospora]KAF3215668.1 hypothetical protein TWF106_008675 [Orbilia oligospora]KAF3227218.1 hypothetical protein TWF191_004085 [Orbilia oligospora]KAF3246872.1 hypothetical protein TWF192_006687 [Orbilia oligospora]
MRFFTIFSTFLLTASALPAPHNGEQHPPTYTIPGDNKPTVPSGHPTKFTPYLFRFPHPKDGSVVVNTEDILTSLQPHGFNKSHLHHKFSSIMNGFSADMSDHCVKILKAMLPPSGVIIEPIVTYKVQAPLATPQLADIGNFAAEHPVKKPRQAPAPGITNVQTQTNAPWGLQRISQKEMIPVDFNAAADKAWQPSFKYKFDDSAGEGVDIYVIDTGININHNSFGGRADRVYTAPALKNNPKEGEEDRAGHGTHCAGTTGSRGFGVAKKANIHAIKVMGGKGDGSSADIIAGIDEMLTIHRRRKNEPGFKGSVASMSFGIDVEHVDGNEVSASPALERAIMRANAEGIHTVIAAGNQGIDACRVSPGFLSNKLYNGTEFTYLASAITVGAIDIYDNRADFSNYGPCITTYAPGRDILSTYINGDEAVNVMSGTSMAAPHVAGLVAYFLGEDQSLQTDVVGMKKKIMNTAGKGLLHNIKDEKDTKILAFNGV